jgi:hypothetical protein
MTGADIPDSGKQLRWAGCVVRMLVAGILWGIS